MHRGLVVLALAAVVVPFAAADRSHAAHRAPVRAYFTDGEDVFGYVRPGAPRTLRGAMHELMQGPTAAERARDVRTWIPHGTQVHSARIRGGIAHVDLGHKFLHGHDDASLRARLVEVVYTATQFPHAHRLRLAIEGQPVAFVGTVPTDRFLTRHDVDPPQRSLMPPLSYKRDTGGPETAKTKRLQRKLIKLGYLPSGTATGHYGPQTTMAVLAFQGWEGLGRDGDAGPQTFAALKDAKRPKPRPGSGKRAEVYLGSQVLLLVRGSRAVRAIHISSGAPGTSTPPGSFSIYRKKNPDWSYPFKTWLPFASYFNGGIAFHEYPEVPAYPASHGCVRVPRDDAPTVYKFATIGMPVTVLRG